MTGGGPPAGAPAPAGAPHIPVLLAEVIEGLGAARGGPFVDGTFGAGGYSRAILAAHPDTRVLGIDRDPAAIQGGAALAAEAAGRLTLVQGRFGELDRLVPAGWDGQVMGVALDVGVSSMQLDQAERGFSFRRDGPLDMRMSGEGPSAADLVNGADEGELADVFYHYGEERRARAVARGIVEARRRAPLLTTGALADLVARHVRAEPGGIHPATRVFQGLRIAVNDELGELVRALHAAERVLAPGGRLAVVSFHSLEDRIVKQFLGQRSGRAAGPSRHLPLAALPPPTFAPVSRGPVVPGEAEMAANPRARSARLRVAERTRAAPGGPAEDVVALAALPVPGEGRGGRRGR